MTKIHHLTKEWYDKLVSELNELKNVTLPWILTRLKAAIEQWDLSENAEYEQAMEDKSMAEVKISELEQFLENVEIIDSSSSEFIWYWNTVRVERKWLEIDFEIVGSWEVNIFENKISLDSPLWEKIKGKKVWDTVLVDSPEWEYEIKILSIS